MRSVRLVVAIIALTASALFAGQAARQQPPAKPAPQAPAPMVTQPIAGGLYFVKGGGGANTAFYVGLKHVIAIDAKMTAEAARQMRAEIAKVTDKPILVMIISHSDGDHVNGLDGFPSGMTIISSRATKAEMEEAFKDEKLAGLRAYLPTKTYESESELRGARSDGRPFLITLYQYGPAHTGGDTVALFHEDRVAFIGDLAFAGRDPLIHRSKGGTSAGYVESLKKLIALPADAYLSGHADPLTKDDLKAALASLEEKRAKVRELVGQGKSLDEIKAAMGVPASPGGRFPSLVEVIYLELTEKR